jgi:hypothetical protein
MSVSLTFAAVAVSYKSKILKRLMAVYAEELVKMLADASFQALQPVDQMFAQSELTRWYQQWFNSLPDPNSSSFDMDKFEDVPIVTSSDPTYLGTLTNQVLPWALGVGVPR